MNTFMPDIGKKPGKQERGRWLDKGKYRWKSKKKRKRTRKPEETKKIKGEEKPEKEETRRIRWRKGKGRKG